MPYIIVRSVIIYIPYCTIIDYITILLSWYIWYIVYHIILLTDGMSETMSVARRVEGITFGPVAHLSAPPKLGGGMSQPTAVQLVRATIHSPACDTWAPKSSSQTSGISARTSWWPSFTSRFCQVETSKESTRPGKRLHNYGKSTFVMGKSTN